MAGAIKGGHTLWLPSVTSSGHHASPTAPRLSSSPFKEAPALSLSPPPRSRGFVLLPRPRRKIPHPMQCPLAPRPETKALPRGGNPPPTPACFSRSPPPPSLPAVQHTLSSGGTLWLVPPSIATARCLLVSLQWGSGEETGPDVASGSGEGQRGHGKIYIGEGGWLQASVAAPLAIGDQLSLTGLRCCQPFRPSHPPPPLLLLLLLLVLGRMLCSLSLCFPAPTPLSFCCSGMHAFAQLPPPPPNLIHSITWV